MYTYRKLISLMIVLIFLITVGCNIQETSETDYGWRKNTLELFHEAEVERGKYLPIESMLEKNKLVSLDDTWRYVCILQMIHGHVYKKQELKKSLYNYLNKTENIELTDLCKIIYMLEIIAPDSLRLKNIKTFVNNNIIDKNGQIQNIYYNENKQDQNEKKDEEQMINSIYFLSLLKNNKILSEQERKIIINHLLNSWKNNQKSQKNVLTSYSIILSLNNLNYDIKKINDIQSFIEYLNKEYTKIKQQPYEDILKTDLIVELLQLLDSDFKLEKGTVDIIFNQQKGGFPLERDSYASGVGTYIVIRMLKNENFSGYVKDDLIKYINKKQSSNGMFQIDHFSKTNLLPSVLSILAIKNLKDIEYNNFNFVRTELKRLAELNNISLIEVYYSLLLLKDTPYFSQSVDIVKKYLETSEIKVNDINNAYYLFQISGLISEPLPEEIKTPVIKMRKNIY
ncbi:hypothetical protein [Aminipila terrae]|uniref:Uncharacterized protein n=1 Tax=Aminipila terrae TaxID=2697030 RepID=A0A6P1MNA3_9FIRM|nr:hypothetical protein [Aminipila terrae]QHI72485.1 hypothetical protein Ami3637_08835 [Aminipila terrae]